MNKRVTRKRTLVILLTLTMVLSSLGLGRSGNKLGTVNAQEAATATDAELAASTDSELSVTATGENEGENFEYANTCISENFDVNFIFR